METTLLKLIKAIHNLKWHSHLTSWLHTDTSASAGLWTDKNRTSSGGKASFNQSKHCKLLPLSSNPLPTLQITCMGHY